MFAQINTLSDKESEHQSGRTEHLVIHPMTFKMSEYKPVGYAHKYEKRYPSIGQIIPDGIGQFEFLAHCSLKSVFSGKVAEKQDQCTYPKQYGRFPHDESRIFQQDGRPAEYHD